MALVVGPKQNVAPMKTSATSNDQLQQIVTWVSGQQDRDFGLDMVHFSQTRPSGSKSGFDTLAVITADTHGAEPPSFSWGSGTDLFHNMFEWMFGNGWDSPGWTFPDSGEGTFKLCSATLGNGTVNGYQSHWYRAGNDCSDTEHFPITWTITLPIYHYTTPESLQKGVGHLRGSALPVGKNTHAVRSHSSAASSTCTPQRRNEYEAEFTADGDDIVFALAPTTTLNGNLAYGNLVDDVSVAAEGGDGGNLVTNGGFESPSLTNGRRTRAPPTLQPTPQRSGPHPASRRRLAA